MKLTLNNGSTIEFESDAQLLAFVGQQAFDALKAQARAAALQPVMQTLPAPTTAGLNGQPHDTTSLAAALAAAVVAAQQATRDDNDEPRDPGKPVVRRARLSELAVDTAVVPLVGGGFSKYEDAHARLSPIQSVGIGGAVAAAIGVALAKSFFDNRE